MKTTLPYAEKLMSLLSGSPEVKVILDREKRQSDDAEKQARLDCLARIKTLEATEIEAKQNLDLAISAVTAAEAKVKQLKSKVAPIFTAHKEAQRIHGAAMSELSTKHGEGEVVQTLYRLQRLILKTESQITALESQKSYFCKDGDGRLTVRPVSPNVAFNQNVLKKRLEGFEKLNAKTKEFIYSELAPSEIKTLCKSICKAIGQPMQTTEETA